MLRVYQHVLLAGQGLHLELADGDVLGHGGGDLALVDVALLARDVHLDPRLDRQLPDEVVAPVRFAFHLHLQLEDLQGHALIGIEHERVDGLSEEDVGEEVTVGLLVAGGAWLETRTHLLVRGGLVVEGSLVETVFGTEVLLQGGGLVRQQVDPELEHFQGRVVRLQHRPQFLPPGHDCLSQ